jgi:hypothetical protein
MDGTANAALRLCGAIANGSVCADDGGSGATLRQDAKRRRTVSRRQSRLRASTVRQVCQ